jgi:hypothetical protein
MRRRNSLFTDISSWNHGLRLIRPQRSQRLRRESGRPGVRL